MCGFAGFLGFHGQDLAANGEALSAMTDTLLHRGPDDAGCWLDQERQIGLGHRRLSIIDISDAGHQPMESVSGRYIIAFNGEIYNHLRIRHLLENSGQAPAWRGHSDTESLLAGFEAWGIDATVKRAVGMFAFAVWDRKTGTLTLGRDRIGEKPLYFGWQGQGDAAVFLFGSELKALRAHPAFENRINRGAVSLQLRHGCIPAPYSIYQGIAKLQPACLLSVSMRQREPKVWPYWSCAAMAELGAADPHAGTDRQVIDQLEALLKDAVRQQMVADVPLGAFLSGGVDSSVVVALMQAQSSRPVKTFSIGFHEQAYNEAEHAKAVARHLGTEHTEMYVTGAQTMDVIPRLPSIYDEPFSDSSQIPTFLVARLAREHVKVALSGDAGDELFCGYTRYRMAQRVWRTLSAAPIPLRRLVARMLTGVSPQAWDRVAAPVQEFLPPALRFANIGHKLHKAAGVLECHSVDALYRGLTSHWPDPAAVVLGGTEPSTLLTGGGPALDGLEPVSRMMELDMLTYLPDDILVKVDRAAMSVSLETRVPLLDHRVVEHALRLPLSMKLRGGETKWVLRQVLYRHVPKELIERPKMGFGIPLGDWLRGPLREWGEALLDRSRLRRESFFEPGQVGAIWKEHLSGRRNWEYLLWDVLMFQAWLEESVRVPGFGSAHEWPASHDAGMPGTRVTQLRHLPI